MVNSLAFTWIATLMLTSMVGVLLVGFFASRTTMFEYDRLRIERAQVAFVDDMAVYYQQHGSWDGLQDPGTSRLWQIKVEGDSPFFGTAETVPAIGGNAMIGSGVAGGNTDIISLIGPLIDGLTRAFSGFIAESSGLSQSAAVPGINATYTTNADGTTLFTSTDNVPSTMARALPPPFFAIANRDHVVVSGFGPFQIGQRVTAPLIEDGAPITVDGNFVGTALLAEGPKELNPWEKRYLDNTNRALIAAALGSGVISLLIGVLLSRHFLRPLTELTHAITEVQQGNLAQQVQVRTNDELGTLARAFNHMSIELHRANQLRIQMTADIAHDLRTPLMVISGYLEALRDGTLPPTVERFDAMNQETLLLKRLIEDLRTLSLADAGELKLLTQEIPPQDMLEQVKDAFQPLADEAGITLSLAPVPESLPRVSVDRARMVQVLGNLVSNALRYTHASGEITLAAITVNDHVQLVISDTGAGIAADKLPNIFERFYRGDDSRTQVESESGLGLAIAKAIVEAHRGTITATSDVGIGTKMIILLPVAA